MAVWDTATLVVDVDLTTLESQMPQLAEQRMGASGQTALYGKRAEAKAQIGSDLLRRGWHTNGIKTPSQLKRAAVRLELALIYRDMARANDPISTEKADFYLSAYRDEMDGLSIDYDESLVPDAGEQVFIQSSTLWRA